MGHVWSKTRGTQGVGLVDFWTPHLFLYNSQPIKEVPCNAPAASMGLLRSTPVISLAQIKAALCQTFRSTWDHRRNPHPPTAAAPPRHPRAEPLSLPLPLNPSPSPCFALLPFNCLERTVYSTQTNAVHNRVIVIKENK